MEIGALNCALIANHSAVFVCGLFLEQCDTPALSSAACFIIVFLLLFSKMYYAEKKISSSAAFFFFFFSQ